MGIVSRKKSKALARQIMRKLSKRSKRSKRSSKSGNRRDVDRSCSRRSSRRSSKRVCIPKPPYYNPCRAGEITLGQCGKKAYVSKEDCYGYLYWDEATSRDLVLLH